MLWLKDVFKVVYDDNGSLWRDKPANIQPSVSHKWKYQVFKVHIWLLL